MSFKNKRVVFIIFRIAHGLYQLFESKVGIPKAKNKRDLRNFIYVNHLYIIYVNHA